MNTTDQSRASNALGGKTARACDSCLLKRARWFCAADDAFLCQACDTAVHSANQLASRHERVRLGNSSCKVMREVVVMDSSSSPPAWHQGFTRKARTPRQAKSSRPQPPANHHQLPLVPEISSEDPFPEENDEQLFCRVPVFDAFAEEFCTEIVKAERVDVLDQDGGNMMMQLEDDGGACRDLNLDELLSNCEDELAEFAADVESLLGAGVEEENHDCQDGHNGIDEFVDGKRVKIEEKDDDDEDQEVQAVIACHFDPALDMELNWGFNYASSSMTEEAGEDMKKVAAVKTTPKIEIGDESSQDRKRMFLRLNYEAVIAAWATQGSPWTDGIRPQFINLDEFMVACLGGDSDHQWGGFGVRSSGGNDAGREARVSRYREKRRTRLFSKKIRYEVRKLNAEKRPRMKGRFVKRTPFSGSSLPYLMNK